MAIVKACLIGNTLKNTGKECDISMGPTAMLIAIPPDTEFDDNDLADPVGWLTGLIHANKGVRVYPFFGQKAPIKNLNSDQEADVVIALDDGSKVFLRYGFINRTFETTSGGICYAKSLQGLNKSGYSILEIDQQGQMLVHQNDNGKYKGLFTDFMFSPAPQLPDLKSKLYMNRFQISYSPVEYVNFGTILAGALPLLSLMGLIDVEIIKAADTTNSGSTRATGTDTITAIGADGDTINVKVNGTTISGGAVAKTSAESSVTLLAAKIVLAINGATATNGGYTAANTAGAITVTAPASMGATLNTISLTNTIVGTITATVVAFSGGVTGTAKLKIGVRTECAHSDLLTKSFAGALAAIGNFVVTNQDGTVIPVTAIALVGGHIELTIPYVAGTYTVKGAEASVWYAIDIDGYDGSSNGADIVITG